MSPASNIDQPISWTGKCRWTTFSISLHSGLTTFELYRQIIVNYVLFTKEGHYCTHVEGSHIMFSVSETVQCTVMYSWSSSFVVAQRQLGLLSFFSTLCQEAYLA